MMWYLQLIIEWAGAMPAQDVIVNLIFACLALGAGFTRSQRPSAVLLALVYLLLALT